MVIKKRSNIFSVLIICICWVNCSGCVPSESQQSSVEYEINHRHRYNDASTARTMAATSSSPTAKNNDMSQLSMTSQQIIRNSEQQLLVIDLLKRTQSNSINLSDAGASTKTTTTNDDDNDGHDKRVKRESSERNLCKSVCNCELNKNFLSADCAFQNEFAMLKPNKFFPNSTTLVHLRLSHNAGLRIDENMFMTNRINRISIQGTYPHSEEHLEFNSRAFFGNNGPFPEIEIKNVHTVLIQANAFYREFQLNIVDCHKVVIFGEAFKDTKFNGYFNNIPNLIILERAFTRSDAKVYIDNCTIDQLQRLEAPLKEIKFTNSRINEIMTGAFDVITINSIIFENCILGKIQKHAFSEKLLSNHLAIVGSEIDTIETGAITDSGITDFIFTNNSVDKIKEKAITLTTINIQIINNTINFLERFWIRIEKSWSNVTVAQNRFGEYNQMMVENTNHPAQCLFENNYITKARLGSLDFKSPICRIKEIAFNEPCACNASLFKHLAYSDYRAQYYCTIEPTLVHCFNANLLNVLDYERKLCDASTKIDCLSANVNIKRDGSFINLNDIIKNSSKFVYICAVAGVLLALLLIIIAYYSIRCYMRKDIGQTQAHDMMIMANLHPLTPSPKKMNGPLTLAAAMDNAAAAPTMNFTTADMEVIRESLDRLKQKYPSEIYDQVHNNTQKLVVGGLNEAERVGIIGEIVKNLDDCQDMGQDLVPFTSILYNHLGPTDERIYFEPDEQQQLHHNAVGNGLYAISGGGGGGGNAGNHLPLASDHDRLLERRNDPIYAEPNVQLPLLKNEYMQPVDRTEAENTPLYSEPIFDSSAKGRIVSSPMHNVVHSNNNISLNNIKSNNTMNKNSNNNAVNVMYSQVNKPSAIIAMPSTSKQNPNNPHPPYDQHQQQHAVPPYSTFMPNSNQDKQQQQQQQQQRTKTAKRQYRNSNSSSSETNSCSEHSGGSGDTLQIDDMYDKTKSQQTNK